MYENFFPPPKKSLTITSHTSQLSYPPEMKKGGNVRSGSFWQDYRCISLPLETHCCFWFWEESSHQTSETPILSYWDESSWCSRVDPAASQKSRSFFGVPAFNLFCKEYRNCRHWTQVDARSKLLPEKWSTCALKSPDRNKCQWCPNSGFKKIK